MKKVVLRINGRSHQFIVEPDRVLLDLLREDLRLTGAKQSCDRKGQCGACTVIVNGKAVRSCLQKVAKLDGAEVITVEGLGTPDNPHLIHEAFVLSGAVQCGFCTPGMIMASKALLDRNPNPDVGEIKKALEHNLCRCTGYNVIIDAVKLAGRFIRGETTPGALRPNPDGPKIGVSHPRPSAMLKACGLAEFSADIKLQDALEVAVTLSSERHAKIRSVDTSVAEKMPGVVGVMTSKDIKGTNRLKIIFGDQPLLAEGKVQCLGDPIAIVVAQTRAQALAAADAVRVDYEPLPVLGTPEEAMAEGAPQIHAQWPNLCFRQPQIKGDAAKAIAGSTAVVEANFFTQINHQAPLEPEATLAYIEGEGEDAQLVVVGRSIDIHRDMGILQEALGYENVRYEEAFSGGQFGQKAAALTSEALAAAAALHFHRPARYIPSLAESFLITTKRHAFNMKVKLAADKNGKLTVFDIDFVVDNGAYQIIGIPVVMRSLWMLSGSYNIPNVNALSRLVYTNNPAGGAARGAGPPQITFALESAVDMLAERMGIDPLEFRKINSLLPGQSVSTGMVYDQWPFPELCDAIKPSYEKARKAAAGSKSGPVKRGVGLGCHAFGVASPGDQGWVAVELDPDDGLTIFAAVADPGEGNDSMLTQIASHVSGKPMSKIRLVTRDTDRTAAMGPAAGSRMTYMAGGSMMLAIDHLQKAMKEAGADTYEGLKKAGKPTRYVGSKQAAGERLLDPQTGQGSSFESRVFAIQMAEVEVNTDTGDVRVVKVTTAVDAGTVINPQNLIGQLHGGMDQGVGYALREEYIHGKTKDWATFKFPTMKTAFDMDVIIRETPRTTGPLGATGVGEMTMVCTAPAVINAIYDACGARVCNLPATPEKVKAALAAKT